VDLEVLDAVLEVGNLDLDFVRLLDRSIERGEAPISKGRDPVDAAVSLFHHRWRPRDAIVDHSAAVRVEVLSLTEHVGADHSEWVPGHSELFDCGLDAATDNAGRWLLPTEQFAECRGGTVEPGIPFQKLGHVQSNDEVEVLCDCTELRMRAPLLGVALLQPLQ